MQAALASAPPAWDDAHRRLAVCMAISTAAVLLFMSALDWPPAFDWSRLAPGPLEISIHRPPGTPEAAPRELPPPPIEAVEPATPAPATAPAAVAHPAEAPPRAEAAPVEPAQADPALAEPPPVAAAGSDAPSVRVDWYAELERAAAEISARAAAEPQSMHPEFDELRRIAALRYGPPQTAVGDSLSDEFPEGRFPRSRNLVNEYAFGSFDSNMLVFTFPIGRPKPKNLPWVATIRARYEYLREPDELPPIGTPSTIPGISATTGTAVPAMPGGKRPPL